MKRFFVSLLAIGACASAVAATPTNGKYIREGGSSWFQLYDTGAALTYSDADTVFKCPKASEGVYACEPWDTDPFFVSFVDEHTVATWSSADTTPRRWITDAAPPAAPTDAAEIARAEQERKQREAADLRALASRAADLQGRAEAEQQQQQDYAAAEADRVAAAAQSEAEKRQSEQDLQDSLQRLNDTVAGAEALAKNPGASGPSAASGSAAPTEVSGAREDSSRDVSAPSANTGGAGAPLRFVLDIGLQPRAGDTVNPTCYSNVITRPGPPGWGQRGFLPPDSARSAKSAVDALKSAFIQACRSASGREITSEGNFHWTWNETQDGEAQISNARARYREDVTVQL